MTFPVIDMRKLAEQCRQKFFNTALNADLVITTDRRHIAYLTGYRSILHDGTSPYAQAAIASRDKVILVTGASDAAAALEIMGDVSAIWRYGSFFVGAIGGVAGYHDMPNPRETFIDAVLAGIAAFGMERGTFALDTANHALETSIRDRFPNLNHTSAQADLVTSRSVKLPDELTLLRYASHITDEALALAIAALRHGDTECDFSSNIQSHIVRNGGIPRFTVVTSGERSSRVDAYATQKIINAGDIVRLDIGCTVNGYSADMARTIVLGEPTSEIFGRYDALLAGEQAQVALVRPGISTKSLYDVAMSTVRKGALPDYQRNHCGHGIGLASHEFPLLDGKVDVPLVPGMVLCLETPYYELGWGGMMVEDTVIVTETGHELLTGSSRALVPPHLSTLCT